MRNQAKIALITGASYGIGRAIAESFSMQGYELLTVDRVAPEKLLNNEAFFKVDLLNKKDIEIFCGNLKEDHKVDVLINNAGLVIPESAETTSMINFEKTMRLNAEVPFRLMQAVVNGMKAKTYGRIVNIASRVVLGKELRSSYAASKGALVAMTRTWALELGSYGITANCISPGPIRTEMFLQNNSLEKIQQMESQLPVKRLGEPNDIACAALYLADEKSGFITGQNIYLCGGMTVGLSFF